MSCHIWTVCCSHLTVLYGTTGEEDASKEVDACLILLFQWAASCDKKQFVAGNASPSNVALVDVRREPLGLLRHQCSHHLGHGHCLALSLCLHQLCAMGMELLS